MQNLSSSGVDHAKLQQKITTAMRIAVSNRDAVAQHLARWWGCEVNECFSFYFGALIIA